MLLPLVGQAGAVTAFARANHIAFGCYLLTSIGLSILAIFSKLERRRRDESPLPYFSIVLAVLGGLLMFALLAGLLRI